MNPNPVYRLDIAYKIRNYLMDHQMSISKFANDCKISVSTLKKILALQGNIRVETLFKIAQTMGCSVGELTGPSNDLNVVIIIHKTIDECGIPAEIIKQLASLNQRQLQIFRLYSLWIMESNGHYNEKQYLDLYHEALSDINESLKDNK